MLPELSSVLASQSLDWTSKEANAFAPESYRPPASPPLIVQFRFVSPKIEKYKAVTIAIPIMADVGSILEAVI